LRFAIAGARLAEENISPGTVVSAAAPTVTFEKRIDLAQLSEDSNIFGIAYSPDGSCLALAISNLLGTQPPRKDGIVIWNLESGKVQAQFEIGGSVALARLKLTWSPDGRFITFGAHHRREPLKFWDPLTGTVARTLDLAGYDGTFNRDGKKFAMLVRTAGFVDVQVYNTVTWKHTFCDTYPVTPDIVGWTRADKIFVAGRVRRYSRGNTPTPPDQSEADWSIKLDDTTIKNQISSCG
jgi:WD40 repeat protein